MGGTIAKFAFMPPAIEQSRQHLAKLKQSGELQIVPTSEGNQVALMHLSCNGGTTASLVTPKTYSYKPSSSSSSKKTRKTMIWCHGNAEDLCSIPSYIQLCETFNKNGAHEIDVICFDYIGYSYSSNVTPTEDTAYESAEAAITFVTKTMNVAWNDIIITGRSLGTGVACEMARRYQNKIQGLVLVAPLKSATHVASGVAAFCLYPADIFCSIRKISQFTKFPVLILHGVKDEVISFSHGQELHEESKKVNKHSYFVPLANSGHNGIEDTNPVEFFSAFKQFFEQLESRVKDLGQKQQQQQQQQTSATAASGGFSSSSSL